MADIKIKTGVETYNIRDEKDNIIGVLEFNPVDSNILKRYQTVVDAFNNFKAEETGDDIADVNKMSDFVENQFDFLLGYPVSKGIFGQLGALTPCGDGTVYFVNVLNAIGDIIESTTKKRTAKINAQVNKAMEKYRK